MVRYIRLGLLAGLALACSSEQGQPAAAGGSGATGGAEAGGASGAGASGSGAVGGSGGSSGSGGSGGSSGSGGSAGAGGVGGATSAGTMTLSTEPCEKVSGKATKCERYEVTCDGLDPAMVDLAFFEPAGGATQGQILFGSGSAGTGFYNFTRTAELVQAGFSVVERRWPAGWFTGATQGPQQAACRLATVLAHLRSTLPESLPLCATGNSGGSAELGFALTWQGAGASLAYAMPTSGPFHRLDLACQGESDASWPAECAALKASRCPDCASQACQLGAGPSRLIDTSFGGVTRCTQPAAGDLAVLKQHSPIFGPSVGELGDLPILFLVGKDDPGAYQPLATALSDSLAAAGANVELQFVAGAPHEMDGTTQGSAAIEGALLSRCKPR